jgi:hypothetical protein
VEAEIMNEALLIKSIKSKGPKKVDVKRYYYGLQKFNAMLISFALLVSLFGSYIFGEFAEYVPKTLDYENRIKQQYDYLTDIYKSNGTERTKTFEVYLEEQYDYIYKKRFRVVFISHTIWIIPLIFFIFWRFPPPVRFDRDKQIIYTWQMGKFYYARFDQIEPKFPKGHKLHTSADFGPLEISLFDANKQKEKRFRIGAHFAYKYQSGDLYQWLRAYMNHQVENDAFLSKNNQWLENSWVEKSIFPPRQLPEEKTTQALTLID